MTQKDNIDLPLVEVFGAREHNLKNIDVAFPRNQLVVITGLSGSGKSSLAFDTIYAEGQRRYMETFSAYSRQFMGGMERPDVDKINGLSPVIAIEQKTTGRNPRSTVGTITEIYDFLRLLFARVGDAYSSATGELMQKMSEEQITNTIVEKFNDTTISILAPVIKGRKGHYRELFEQITKQGYVKVRIDGIIQEIKPKMQLDRYKIHDIEIVIDRILVTNTVRKRLHDSILTALKTSKGLVKIATENSGVFNYSKFLMCPTSGISYEEPQPNTFSFNSPYGACPECDGVGLIYTVDANSIFPNPLLSISEGGIAPLGKDLNTPAYDVIKALAKKYHFGLNTPIKDLSHEQYLIILNGVEEPLTVKVNFWGFVNAYDMEYTGIKCLMSGKFQNKKNEDNTLDERYRQSDICPLCNGARLKAEALQFKINHKNIHELSSMNIKTLFEWLNNLEDKLTTKNKTIAKEILKELSTRISFLLDVGLDYLTLNRTSQTLSGGEAQRIRLATQIGSQLMNVMYILDEPSIGLHQRDNERLIIALKKLRDLNNTVLVVEHDKDMILEADYVLDIGPAAGIHGGKIIAQGTPSQILSQKTLTTQYLTGEKRIEIPASRRHGNGKQLILHQASGNNLKNVTASFELGKFIVVTGVSGSGKSTLIIDTLYPILNKHFFYALQKALTYKKIEGLQHIDKVIEIDQSPIGRTPRSNPATYTSVFSDIRTLFAQVPEAKIRGYKVGRFSFNVKGGRCEDCQGAGLKIIEMNFLPDVQVHCETCNGKRYNRETLDIRYKGKSINDVLNMSIEEACVFFEHIPSIYRKIKTLQDVGLGYITLGQSSTTLSGGEAQRVKLSTELSKKDTGNTFYILDEPTTGLHFEDINILIGVLNKLVDKGNTVLVIEHNLDMIKIADQIIDIGTEGGEKGGHILFSGTPEDFIHSNVESHTKTFLKKEFLSIT